MSVLYLMGFRGAGKTTLGQRLAEKIGWEFFDCDQEWERQNARTIVDFVEEQGIEAFRIMEEMILQESLRKAETSQGLVVATGGGFVDWRASVTLLQAAPWPRVFLDVDAEELWKRLSAHPHRLKIGHLGNLLAISELLDRRRPIFKGIATYQLKNRDISVALIELASLVGFSSKV